MLSPNLLAECCFLIYSKWADAFDNHNAVKEEKDDGTPDWTLFHAQRLLNSEKTLAKYKRLLDEIRPHNPIKF